MKTWLTKVGPYTVEKIICPGQNRLVDLTKPRVAVIHTTEGYWSGSLAVFKQSNAPHFLVDKGRIAQLLPLGWIGAALENASGGVETNGWAVAQIEVVGFSKATPWVFPKETMDVLANLMYALKLECDVPFFRPFPDTMPPLPWATTDFSRRKSGKWGTTAGWFGHVEVPENSHWDPGALDWSQLIAAAKAVEMEDTDVQRLATLCKWVAARIEEDGWTWDQIKATFNWRELLSWQNK